MVAALIGACEGLGVQSIWQWLFAVGKTNEHSNDHDKVWPMQMLCCDSSSAVSIMRRAGDTRRVRHIELEAPVQLDNVKDVIITSAPLV